MNSRNSVNEKNFVKYSSELSLNQFEVKERIEIPFDHIYACHSRSLEVQRPNLQLAKEVEITTQCVPADLKAAGLSEVAALRDRIAGYERKIKKLKSLLIHHIDLAQLQSDYVNKREKYYQAIKQENDTLRTRLLEMEKKLNNQRRSQNQGSSATVNVTQQGRHQNTGPQLLLNSNYTELLIPSSRTNTFLFENDLNSTSTFHSNDDIKQESESSDRASPDLVVTSILDSSIPFSDFILENPQTLEMDKTENHNDALYSVATTNSNSVIQKMQKNNRKTTGTTSTIGRSKIEMKGTNNQYTPAKNLERKYTVNKKSRMINTYSKSTNSITIKPSQYTGSLTERLQLIDNTPVGEDPYQMRESDLREQSPIPKLMLQKTNHGRIKICSCDNVSNNTEPTRRIYDPVVLDDSDKCTQNKFNTQHSYISHADDLKKNKKNRTVLVNSPCLDIVKTEPGIDWSIYSAKTNNKIKTSVCDYSYGETSSLHSQTLPSLDTDEFQNLFSSESPFFQTHDINQEDYNAFDVKGTLDKTKRKCGRSSNSISNNDEEELLLKDLSNQKGRKRAQSTTGLIKANKKAADAHKTDKSKCSKGIARSGSLPNLPVLEAIRPYHTTAGDAVWYLGPELDPKPEDLIPPNEPCAASLVEVPRWREKVYSPLTLPPNFNPEDDPETESSDDAVFEKRHQKYETMERRQLKYHLRHIREQKLVEKLRQRQRDPWGQGTSTSAPPQPREFTILPQPHKDAQLIEIGRSVPVSAFGENIRKIPESEFKLPWVRSSRPLKRSKRSKTLNL